MRQFAEMIGFVDSGRVSKRYSNIINNPLNRKLTESEIWEKLYEKNGDLLKKELVESFIENTQMNLQEAESYLHQFINYKPGDIIDLKMLYPKDEKNLYAFLLERGAAIAKRIGTFQSLGYKNSQGWAKCYSGKSQIDFFNDFFDLKSLNLDLNEGENQLKYLKEGIELYKYSDPSKDPNLPAEIITLYEEVLWRSNSITLDDLKNKKDGTDINKFITTLNNLEFSTSSKKLGGDVLYELFYHHPNVLFFIQAQRVGSSIEFKMKIGSTTHTFLLKDNIDVLFNGKNLLNYDQIPMTNNMITITSKTGGSKDITRAEFINKIIYQKFDLQTRTLSLKGPNGLLWKNILGFQKISSNFRRYLNEIQFGHDFCESFGLISDISPKEMLNVKEKGFPKSITAWPHEFLAAFAEFCVPGIDSKEIQKYFVNIHDSHRTPRITPMYLALFDMVEKLFPNTKINTKYIFENCYENNEIGLLDGINSLHINKLTQGIFERMGVNKDGLSQMLLMKSGNGGNLPYDQFTSDYYSNNQGKKYVARIYIPNTNTFEQDSSNFEFIMSAYSLNDRKISTIQLDSIISSYSLEKIEIKADSSGEIEMYMKILGIDSGLVRRIKLTENEDENLEPIFFASPDARQSGKIEYLSALSLQGNYRSMDPMHILKMFDAGSSINDVIDFYKSLSQPDQIFIRSYNPQNKVKALKAFNEGFENLREYLTKIGWDGDQLNVLSDDMIKNIYKIFKYAGISTTDIDLLGSYNKAGDFSNDRKRGESIGVQISHDMMAKLGATAFIFELLGYNNPYYNSKSYSKILSSHLEGKPLIIQTEFFEYYKNIMEDTSMNTLLLNSINMGHLLRTYTNLENKLINQITNNPNFDFDRSQAVAITQFLLSKFGFAKFMVGDKIMNCLTTDVIQRNIAYINSIQDLQDLLGYDNDLDKYLFDASFEDLYCDNLPSGQLSFSKFNDKILSQLSNAPNFMLASSLFLLNTNGGFIGSSYATGHAELIAQFDDINNNGGFMRIFDLLQGYLLGEDGVSYYRYVQYWDGIRIEKNVETDKLVSQLPVTCFEDNGDHYLLYRMAILVDNDGEIVDLRFSTGLTIYVQYITSETHMLPKGYREFFLLNKNQPSQNILDDSSNPMFDTPITLTHTENYLGKIEYQKLPIFSLGFTAENIPIATVFEFGDINEGYIDLANMMAAGYFLMYLG